MDAEVVIAMVAVEGPVVRHQRVAAAPVVRPSVNAVAEADLAGQAGDHAHDSGVPVWPRVALDVTLVDGHEVGDLGQAIDGLEDGAQDVGLVRILVAARERTHRAELPGAASLVIEEPAENAGAVEPRQAAPVDAAVHAHQRQRAAVADDTVVADRQVAARAQDPRGNLAAAGGVADGAFGHRRGWRPRSAALGRLTPLPSVAALRALTAC